MSNAFARPSEFSSPEPSAHYPANKLYPVVPAPLASYGPGTTILFRLPAYQNAFIDPSSFRVSGLLNIKGTAAKTAQININSSASSLFSKIQYSSGSQQETVDQYPSTAHVISTLGLARYERAAEIEAALGDNSIAVQRPNLGAEMVAALTAGTKTHSFSVKLLGSLADITKPIPANFNYAIELTLASVANAFVASNFAVDNTPFGSFDYTLTEVRLSYVGSETPMYRELFPNPVGVYHSIAYQTYQHTIPKGAVGRINVTLPFTASSATNLILMFEATNEGTGDHTGDGQGGALEACPAGIGSISPNLTQVQMTYGSKSWPTNPLRANFISEVMENNRIAMNSEVSGAAKRSAMSKCASSAMSNAIDMTRALPSATYTLANGAFTVLGTVLSNNFVINLDLSKTHSGRAHEGVFSGIGLSSNQILSLDISTATPAVFNMRALLVSETLITLDETTNTMSTAF